MSAENLGTIGMEAEIDFSKLRSSTKNVTTEFDQMIKSAKLVEDSFNSVEKSGEAAWGSLSQLTKEAEGLKKQLSLLDPESKKFKDTAVDLNRVLGQLSTVQKQATVATGEVTKGFTLNKLASDALVVSLGMLGVQSVTMVVSKMVSLTRESLKASISLEGMQNRAKALFGDAYPQLVRATDNIAFAMNRSSSSVMQYATSFGSLLDSAGASQKVVNSYSTDLAQLVLVMGKAHPQLSDATVYQAIEGGIRGNSRALSELGIVMKDKQLQDLLEHLGYKTKLADLDQNQLMMLRSEFLLKETTKQQDAAALSQGNLGDSIKTTTDAWTDLLEELGTDLSPLANGITKILGGAIQFVTTTIQDLKGVWNSLPFGKMGADNPFNPFRNAQGGGATVPSAGVDDYTMRNAFGPAGGNTSFAQNDNAGAYNAKNKQGSGDAQKKEAEMTKLLLDVEKDRYEHLKKIMEVKRDTVGLTENEEKHYQRLSKLTGAVFDIVKAKDFKGLLEEMNKQTDDMEKSFDAVGTKIDAANKKMKDLLEQSRSTADELKGSLGKLQEDFDKKYGTGSSLGTAQADQAKNIAEAFLEAEKVIKQAQSGMTVDQKVLDNARSTIDSTNSILEKGAGSQGNKDQATKDEIAQLEIQLAYYEKIKDAKMQNGVSEGITDTQTRLATLRSKLGATPKGDMFANEVQMNVDQGRAMDKGNDVDKAKLALQYQKQKDQEALEAKQREYQLSLELEEAFQKGKLADFKKNNEKQLTAEQKAHIDTLMRKQQEIADELKLNTDLQQQITAILTGQIAVRETASEAYKNNEVGRLNAIKQAALDAASAIASANAAASRVGSGGVKKAMGGAIFGPGGGTDDLVPAMLSNGEHVLTASEVRAAGGHGAIYALRNAIMSGFKMPRFATGGAVSNSTSSTRSVVVNNNYHGDSARAMGRPNMLSWHARMINR